MLPLFVLAHFGHHLVSALLVPLLPFIRDDLSLDYTQTGWLVSAFTLAYGISQLPAGWIADRIGRRVVITIGIVGGALTGLIIGLSTTYIMMIVFLVLMGIAGGGYHPRPFQETLMDTLRWFEETGQLALPLRLQPPESS